jgi:peroxiredoxin Q/BCP
MRLIAAAFASLFLGALSMADDSKLKVKEGDAFPNVPVGAAQIEKATVSKDAKTMSIADLKGKTVVIFFYPRASTGGCTAESCGFRDIAEKFPKGTVIIGASNDNVDKQMKFINDHKLPFALLTDTDNKLIKELGIANPSGTAAQRITFIVNPEGKIAKIYTKVTPKEHPAEVLKDVEAMSKK